MREIVGVYIVVYTLLFHLIIIYCFISYVMSFAYFVDPWLIINSVK